MNITQQDFARLANAAAKIADSKHPIPTLRMARVEAVGGVMSVMATDMDIWLTLTAPCEGYISACLVPADKLADTVSKLKADTLAVERDGDALVIKAKGSRRKLATLPADSFPVMPDIEGDSITLDAARLREGLAFTLPFASTDPTRTYLHGVCMDTGEGEPLRMIATDANSMAEFRYGESEAGDMRLILPTALAKAIDSAIDSDTVDMTFDDRRAAFSWAGCAIVGKLVEGSFPDTDRVTPSGPFEHSATAPANELAAACAGVQTLGTGSDKGAVKLQCQIDAGGFSIEGQSAQGEAIDAIACAATGNLRFGVSSAYFSRAMKAFGDADICINARDAAAPLLVNSDAAADRFVVVMPMRI